MKRLFLFLVFLPVVLFGQSTPTTQYKTVADMLAASIPPVINNRMTAIVTGRVTTNDGYGGMFIYDSGASDATNLGTNLKPNTANGRWKRQFSGAYNAGWFSAVGDGDTLKAAANTLAIQNAINTANAAGGGNVLIPKGSFAFSGNLFMSNNVTLLGEGFDSELLYTGAGSAIATANANNTNIAVKSLKLRFATTVDGTGIGISLSGLTGGSIENCWIDGVGGYSILVGQNNDTASTEGKRSSRVSVLNNRMTGVCDVGIEFAGADDCLESGNYIEGPGSLVAVGAALVFWRGAQNNRSENTIIKGTSTNLIAVWLNRHQETNSTFRQTSNNVISGVYATGVSKAIQIGFGEITNDWLRVYGTRVENSVFYGQTNKNIPAISVARSDGVEIVNCRIEGFFGPGIDVSGPNISTLQDTVTNVTITGSTFVGGGALHIYGADNVTIADNYISAVDDNAGIKLFGVQRGRINNNNLSEIGSGANSSGILVNKGAGSITRESLYLNIVGNKSYDNRAVPWTVWTVQLSDATDYCVVLGNSSAGGKPGFDVVSTSTGTHNSLLSSQELAGFQIQAGDFTLDNSRAIKTYATGGALRPILSSDGSDRVILSGLEATSDLLFGPILGNYTVSFKASGNVEITGDLVLNNTKALRMLAFGGASRPVLTSDATDRVILTGLDATSDLLFGPIQGSNTVVFKASGQVGIGNIVPGALLDLGNAGVTHGTLRLAGSTSGNVGIEPAVVAGTWTLTLPVNDGNAGDVLTTDGAGFTQWLPATTVPTATSMTGSGADFVPGAAPYAQIVFGGGNMELALTAGTWFVSVTCQFEANNSFDQAFKLRNTTDSLDIADSERIITTGGSGGRQIVLQRFVTVGSAKTLGVWVLNNDPTYSTLTVYSTRSDMVAIRIP